MTPDLIASLTGFALLMGAVLIAVGIGFWHEWFRHPGQDERAELARRFGAGNE